MAEDQDGKAEDFILKSGGGLLPCTEYAIAMELRKMADGEGEYHRFLYLSSRIKAVWCTAAALLERHSATP